MFSNGSDGTPPRTGLLTFNDVLRAGSVDRSRSACYVIRIRGDALIGASTLLGRRRASGRSLQGSARPSPSEVLALDGLQHGDKLFSGSHEPVRKFLVTILLFDVAVARHYDCARLTVGAGETPFERSAVRFLDFRPRRVNGEHHTLVPLLVSRVDVQLES
jgi:hypothetical protein